MDDLRGDGGRRACEVLYGALEFPTSDASDPS